MKNKKNIKVSKQWYFGVWRHLQTYHGGKFITKQNNVTLDLLFIYNSKHWLHYEPFFEATKQRTIFVRISMLLEHLIILGLSRVLHEMTQFPKYSINTHIIGIWVISYNDCHRPLCFNSINNHSTNLRWASITH
jgi:hypothetical protein